MFKRNIFNMKAIIKLEKQNLEKVYGIFSWKLDSDRFQFILSDSEKEEGVEGVLTILMEGNDMDLFKRLMHGPRKLGFYGELDRLIEAGDDED